MKKQKRLVFFIALIAATGGLLFGFDTGVISGAIMFLRDDWGLMQHQVEWIIASLMIGAVIGAAFSGKLVDSIGRKYTIIIIAILFALGSLGSAFAPSFNFLALSRVVIGIAVGMASFTVPLYIAEISPARNRGALVSLNQLMITIGILLSYLSDLALVNVSDNWRWMFFVGLFPALVLLIGMLGLPKTPRFLMSKGREKEARETLAKYEDAAVIDEVMLKMKIDMDLLSSQKKSWKDIFNSWMIMPFIIGIGIMFFQQFIGINVFIYYGPMIFEMAGFQDNYIAIATAISIGFVNVFFTFVAMAYIDRIGRKKLYNIGLTGMIISLTLLGYFFYEHQMFEEHLKILVVVFTLSFVAFFAISLGPIAWLIISEIFPLKIRGLSMSIATLSHWLFNGIVSYTFLKISAFFTSEKMQIISKGEITVNPAGAFWFYAAIGVLGLIFGKYFLPETKGRTLEEIEEHWRKRKNPKDL